MSGRESQQAGDNHEAWINVQHEKAIALGILACVDKIDPPAEKRHGKIEFGERTVSDYIGMCGGGSARYFAEEAKSTLKPYLPKSALTPKQQQHLTTVAKGGGLALLSVEFRTSAKDIEELQLAGTNVPLIRRYCCPWVAVPWQVLKTAQSVSEEDLIRGDWRVDPSPEACYLERFHPRGTPIARGRVYARE